MSRPNPLYRKLSLNGEINTQNITSIINEIHKINHDDDINEQIYANWERKPIYLYIQSQGGSIYDGLALVDVIEQSKTPVYTISIGLSMSMGLWIFLAGKKRLVGKNSTLMFHDVSTAMADKCEGIKCGLEESMRLRDMICETITSRSLVKQEVLDDYLNRKAEWFIPSKQAIDLKLADEYYKEI